MQQPDRIVELDAVRGIAAVMVLITHLPRGFWFGETGVDLFFVLSGFLITGIILRNCGRSGFLQVFYFRRSLRIFPIYYLALAGMALVNSVRAHPAPVDGLPYYFAYVQNVPDYWGGATPPVGLPIGHTWTLAIEEQFYLLWPALLVAIGGRRVVPLGVLLVLCSLILRFLGVPRVTLLGHMDGLALGGMLAAIELNLGHRVRALLDRSYTILMLVGFGGYAALWSSLARTGTTGKQMIASSAGILLVSIAYFGLIGRVQSRTLAAPVAAVLRSPVLISLGTISYGLYLYHWIVYEYIDTIVKFGLRQADPWWLDVIKVSVSLAAAGLSWRFIESPILRLKDRYSYSQAGLHRERSRTDGTDRQPVVSVRSADDANSTEVL